jgi:cytochrome P450
MTGTMEALDYDPGDPALIRNPFPRFAKLRSEKPIYRSACLKGWALTRHADVKRVLGDFQSFSSQRIQPYANHIGTASGVAAEVLQGLSRWVVFTDRPHHSDIRLMMNKAFFPVVSLMEPFVEETVRSLFAEIERRNNLGRDQYDLVQELGIPLPTRVVAYLLGLPEDACLLLKNWSDELGFLVTGVRDAQGRFSRANAAFAEMVEYFSRLVRERTGRPGDDVVSRLVQAAKESRGQISEADIVQNIVILAFAGHETTSDFISMAAFHLLNRPETIETLISDPSLIDGTVEELLRFDSPSAAVVRIAKSDLEIDDNIIERGDRLFCFVNAANRDPAVFTDPESLDIRRRVRNSLSFAYGPHLCLGAPLARMEGRIVLKHLLPRLRNVRLMDGGDVWRPGYTERGLKQLILQRV